MEHHGKLREKNRRKTGQEYELMDDGGKEHKFSCAKWGLIDLQGAIVLKEPLCT